MGVRPLCISGDDIQDLKDAANDRHILSWFPADSLALTPEERPMRPAPIIKRAVSFPFQGGIFSGHLIVGNDFRPGDSRYERWFVVMINDDFNTSLLGNRLTICLVSPKKTRASPLLAGTDESKQLF